MPAYEAGPRRPCNRRKRRPGNCRTVHADDPPCLLQFEDLLNGIYYGVSAKHPQAYLNESRRFNRRSDPFNAFLLLLGNRGGIESPFMRSLFRRVDAPYI